MQDNYATHTHVILIACRNALRRTYTSYVVLKKNFSSLPSHGTDYLAVMQSLNMCRQTKILLIIPQRVSKPVQ